MQTIENALSAETETRTEHCEKHGAYTSRLYLGRIWSRCPKCAEESQQAELEAQKADEQERRVRAWQHRIGHAGIPERFKTRTLETYKTECDGQRKALAFAQAYADGFEDVLDTGRSAVFVGSPGTGKTHLAIGIALEVMTAGHTALFLTVYRAIRRVKDTWNKAAEETEQQAIDALVEPDLLILDEVGVQFGSETEKLILFDVLNERYEQRKPVLLLSNLPAPEVTAYLGQRIADRLREDGGQIVTFDWESARGRIASAESTSPVGCE